MTDFTSETILVKTFQKEISDDHKDTFISSVQMGEKVTEMATKKLSDDLNNFSHQLKKIVENLHQEEGAYPLDEITFSLSVNTSGKIVLIGELAAGMSSAITITFRKKS